MDQETLFFKYKTLWLNGFGFQFDDQNGVFYIAKIGSDIDLKLLDIMTLSKCTTIQVVDFLDRDFIQIDWKDYDKINDVLTALLQKDIPFTTNNELQVTFGKTNQVFDTITMEQKFIKDFEERQKMFNISPVQLADRYSDRLICHWNWMSDEGKAFAQYLCDLFDTKPSIEDYTQWDLFKSMDSTSESDSESMQEETDSEITECMICFANPPDSMVLPCEHSVVCKTCSAKLRNTNDKKTCVRCRREITHVLD